MTCRRNQFDAMRRCRWALPLLALLASIPSAQGQQFQYIEKLVVAEPTKLDWVFPLLEKSPPVMPEALVKETTRGGRFEYEFFGPREGDAAGRAWPLVIFVSPQDRPVGWDFWAPTCDAHGVLFAGVRDAGNGVAVSRRVRATLEVLGDVRSRYRVDPERTYLAGFSGGAFIACRVAFAVPEYVGGVVCIGDAPQLPPDPWARQRLRERLSLAIVCGAREPAGPMVEELDGPMFQAAGVQAETLILPRQGHTMPDAKVMERAFGWLEQGVEGRREIKARLPLTSMGQTLSREEWSAAMLEEARGRFQTPATMGEGLWELEAIVKRWSDLPAAGDAQGLITEYAAKSERPWEAEQRQRQQRVERAEAEGYERLAARSEPALKKQRANLLQLSMLHWEALAKQTDDPELRAEAVKRLAGLRELAAQPPAAGEKEMAATPLKDVRFQLVGEVTLGEGVDRFRQVLAQLGYELTVDPNVQPIIAAGGERQIKLDLPAATYNDIDRRFFRRHGLKLVRKGNAIQLLAMEPKAEAEPSR
jgi:pimeloyl-ACP methyl ester carboxylesterase